LAGNRLRLASLFIKTGIAARLGRGGTASLLIVNYHRLWPSRLTRQFEFDDGVFGPDVDEFRRQMQWLSSATTILDEAGLLDVTSDDAVHHEGLYTAVTFDDAYADCYTLARPVLEELGIRAIFFVPVDMIDSRELGWWDVAAYLLKRTSRPHVSIGGESFDLESRFAGSLRRILDIFKLRPAEETGDLLAQLSRACDVPLPDREAQSAQLMSWDQIREMRASGHGIGSHTFSHRVLATLSDADQEREIKSSREELAARLNAEVSSFAYPVGGPRHINDRSVQYAREAGYRLAFTFNTGMSPMPVADRFRIPRESAH
jgi:peptidoglycan/xylan/chitin deacetylase (PgdA/CDA1 family)